MLSAERLLLPKNYITTRRKVKKYSSSEFDAEREALNWQKLPQLTVSASYHNAGSEDQNPGRLDEALNNPHIQELELDTIFFESQLIAAHGAKSFAKHLTNNPRARYDQGIDRLVLECILKNKAIHFDVKNSVRNPSALKSFTELVNTIPTDIPVMFSGNNWALQERIHERVSRPHTTLFTVNGELHTWGEYKRRYLHALTTQAAPIGVSIRNALVREDIVEALNKRGQRSQVYYVDTATEAVHFDEMGVSGITSNNPALLSEIGRHSLFEGREIVLTA